MRGYRFPPCTLLFLAACSNGGGGGTPLLDRGVCDTLIECASDLAPASRDEYIAVYGEGGTCWSAGPLQWAACRDACADALDALNLVGQATGQTCGTCMTDADCSSLGPGATCQEGLCTGGDMSDGETDGETDGSEMGTEAGTDTDEPACTPNYDAPEECLRFVDCIGALSPEQLADAKAMYGENGTCWCGTEAEAASCYNECIAQLETAIETYPTVAECHEFYCTLDELDPAEPYGPVVDGSCSNWDGMPQEPLVEPFGIPGSVCAPACMGLSQYCPEHSQTSAQGTCYVVLGDVNYCVSRCYVDSTIVGGAQCQCGATCQPHGGPDGEGNARGICTFE